MQMLKRNKGITLVALIITIIILLILAGVSLSFVFNGGILDKAQQAVNEYENASQKEQNLLDQIDKYIENELDGSNADDDTDSEYNSEKGVNKPKLTEGMIPVKYNAASEKWVITNENDEEWYDYNNKQWANVMLSDGKYKTSNSGEYTIDGTTEVEIVDLGSMFVWIPRYAYKITSGYHSSTTGTIEIEFLKGTTNQNDANVNIVEYNEETTTNYTKFPDGYVVHPAFTNNVEVGGWDKEINGIWVAKFEAGYPMEESIDSTAKTSSNMYYPVFKGQRYSYNYTNIGNLYKLGREMSQSGNPYEITSNSNSHMIKNSEWGAVAYLTQSKYGKNTEIYPNNVSFGNSVNNINDKGVYGITGYSALGLYDGVNNVSGQEIFVKLTVTFFNLDCIKVNNISYNNLERKYKMSEDLILKDKTDINLYKEFIDGSKEAFNEIVNRYRNTLILFILRYVKNVEIAEDLAQDTFVYVLINKKEYDFKYSLKTYLFTIAKCRAINYIKKQKRNVQFSDMILEDLHIMDMDESLIKKENKEIILNALSKIKIEYQILIYLRDIQGFNYKEICKILDKTMAQVKISIYRARKSLEKVLREEGEIC